MRERENPKSVIFFIKMIMELIPDSEFVKRSYLKDSWKLLK